MELGGKRVVVVGLGRSGLAAAALCRSRGARVIGTDSRAGAELPESVHRLDIELSLGGNPPAVFESADLVVVSPGVPPLDVLTDAEARGIEVIGELELASRFLEVPIVAVGGTNGKSTVTTLVAGILEAAQSRVFSGGNLGTPLSEAVGVGCDVAVVEVSSFQLERAPSFRPRVSILLNITEDHLDRYPDFATYADAKGNAFVNQTPDDVAIIPAGDAHCRRQASRGRGRQVTYGAAGDYVVRDRAVAESATNISFDLTGVELHGRHNFENGAAAIAAARALGAPRDAVRAGLAAFRPLPHRMVRVGVVAGVVYYDDSKATNVGAAVTALSGLSEPRVVLIAGGRDKHGSYEPLKEVLRARGRAVVAIGEAGPRIAEAVGAVTHVTHAASMNEAVERASQLAKGGDAVLLSPACSSFDWFSGYAERGQKFAEAVRDLVERRTA